MIRYVIPGNEKLKLTRGGDYKNSVPRIKWMLYQGNKSDKNWKKDFSGIGRLYELDINIIGTSHRCKLLSDFFIKNKKGHSNGAALGPYDN